MFLTINIARFHPLFVHLPIGVLIFAALLEFLKWKQKTNAFDATIPVALGFGLLSALFAGASGWLLSTEGGYDEQALWQHKWSGIGLIVLSALLYFAKVSKRSLFQKAYLPIFSFVLLLLGITGHFGGNLTHGSDYLFSSNPDTAPTVVDLEQAAVFPTIVEPILKAKCMSCHNPGKAKGDLIMTTPQALLVGGKTGSLFDFEVPRQSELLRRVHLPLTDKKHMPPKGKIQLTQEETSLLLWWIENNACTDCLVETMKNRASVESILAKYQVQEGTLTSLDIESISVASLAELRAKGLKVNRLSAESNFLIVNLSNQKQIDPSAVKALKKVGENVVELNLANANFSDIFPTLLSAMPHLQKLQVQRTAIDETALESLEKMEYLSSLNVYGTNLTDEAVEKFKVLPALKKLYCWDTKMTTTGITTLQKAKPTLDINYALSEDLFGDSKLNPPTLVSTDRIFMDSMVIKFNTNVKNARFFYTLDGTEPDTTSLLAKDSFYLKESTSLKVIAVAKSWGKSPVTTADFLRANVKVKSAQLAKAPHSSYAGKGANSLIDLVNGTLAFGAGNWIGYQGENLTTTLRLEAVDSVKKVFVSSLAAPNSWIFFPKQIKVWTSMDGKQYDLKVTQNYSPPQATDQPAIQYFDLNFPPTMAKFVKVKVFSWLKNPTWHPAPGEACWIFVDEVLLQ
ncbi:MAG: DUF2231 domain-containing protein [Saprospiraceae bacterium]